MYRQFYKERSVVREERRMRTESDPQGKLLEAMLGTAIIAHPYRVARQSDGPSDIENLRVETHAEKFFDNTYYVPANLTVAIVGDVDPAEDQESLVRLNILEGSRNVLCRRA